MWFYHHALSRAGGIVVSGDRSQRQIARGDLFTCALAGQNM